MVCRYRVIVVAGVSGSGKSTVAHMLARRLGANFLEGDDFHPASNIARMAAGLPLEDTDREPWLRAIAARIDGWLRDDARGVIACSALKRSYRALLTHGRPGVFFAVLDASPELIAERLGKRIGHFMPKSLLASQLATFEPPRGDEQAVRSFTASGPAPATVEAIIRALCRPELDISAAEGSRS